MNFIKLHVTERGWDGTEWITLAQDNEKCTLL
jgi:hypothetical protein